MQARIRAAGAAVRTGQDEMRIVAAVRRSNEWHTAYPVRGRTPALLHLLISL